jgi:transposase InsO family protein
MGAQERAGVIEAVESGGHGRRGRLKQTDIPRSTYYRWKKRYEAGGINGLERRGRPPENWMKLLPEEERKVVEVARAHPELSPRLISSKLLDEQEIAVSESTIFRMLKSLGLVEPRALADMPAAAEWQHKTTGVDQIWQCDATNFFVVGYGYYKGIPVLDDYSRKILAMPVKPDESSLSIADAVEAALEAARKEGHLVEKKPMLLSDNGAGFVGGELARYLSFHGIHHIFGHPYHPQTQGKVEAVNKKIKGRVKMLVYCSPGELEKAVAAAVEAHNRTPREKLKNVCPNDVYAGRMEGILKRRAEIKRRTLERRKEYNRARRLESQRSNDQNLSQNA